MPDVHQGYGMPIGGVVALKGMVIPNAVGVDIGCGMCAIKTSITEINTETLKRIMGRIREEIPMGFNKHKEHQDYSYIPVPDWNDISINNSVVAQERENAGFQVGTLGGGNHFIEIQKGSDGFVWIMIHSGSRNLGLKVASHYNKLAQGLNEKWHSSVQPSWELAFLPADSKEGQAYLNEMNYCVDFALANRKLMMDRICDIFIDVLSLQGIPNSFDPMINIAHNYAVQENHGGENVWVHRKGATLASESTIGIIPGSQGTSSYIVKGKGNPESYNSCSHGAGRTLSRSKAKETLNLEEETAKLDSKGVLHSIRGVANLDEAPGAYKPIGVVMEEQEDLVEIVTKLEPLAVLKA
jgi:tRNA-splicing ligase RtcB